jgi:predicted regulator of Ras-like GTPase activity (Roadblock/LC7/MglB family)
LETLAPVVAATDETVELPLQRILDRLPDPVKRLVAIQPKAKAAITLPLQPILSQLYKGTVKMPLAEFQTFAPEGTFHAGPEQASTPITIPLDVLVPNLKPEHLPRRPGQTAVDLPPDIGPVFGPGGSINAPKPAPAKPAPAPIPPATPVAAKTATPAAPAPAAVAPAPAPAPVAAAPETPQPVAAATAAAPTQPLPKPAAIKPAAPIPPLKPPAAPTPPLPKPEAMKPPAAPTPPLPKPVLPKPVMPGAAISPPKPAPVPGVVPLPKPEAMKPPAAPASPAPKSAAPVPSLLKLAEAAPSAPPFAVPAAPAESSAGGLLAPLEPAMAAWPETLRSALAPLAGGCQVQLPVTETEQGLKRGKIAFSWTQIKQWIKPALPPGILDLSEETPLLIPLNLVVPLFLAIRKPSTAKAASTVDAKIPDVFFAAQPAAAPPAPEVPQPAAVAPPAPPAPAKAQPPQPASPPMAVVEPATPAPEVQPEDMATLFGQPFKKSWTPVEIIQKCSGLPGMSGALIVLQDGLLVAGQMPSPVNSETMAAFLPQMFGRMSHYTRELKLGEPTQFALVVGDVPMQINKVGGIFFLAYGCAGQRLPAAQLELVVAHLEQQSRNA